MTTVKLTDQVKKIIETWHSKFPGKFDDNRNILKWIREFPITRLITISIEKSSNKTKEELLKVYEKDMLNHINRFKNHEKNVIFRQSTILAQLGKVNLRAELLEKKLEELEIKDKEAMRGQKIER